MWKLIVAFAILIVAMTAVAIHIQVLASALSLPLATGTTVLTMLLPLLAAANAAAYTPRILPGLLSRCPAVLRRLALPILQGVLTVALATLALEAAAPGPTQTCRLEQAWQRRWHAHDGRAIERVQDAFACCGLRSLKDRAWPRDGSCPALYRRHAPCLEPWAAAMRRAAGLEFAVAVLVGVIQLVQLAMMRMRSPADGRPEFQRVRHAIGAASRERLLEDGDVDDGDRDGDAGEDGAVEGRGGYSDLVDGEGHRVEPSGLGEERNQWRS
ncbi:hypothetical protein F4780DRAFT_372637 [Xylariomycetidae sp. FL0641]|nr:hypothetical protein F4780DRAFT_372637 [Xylariomycetidae sp. FL0641]